MSAKRPPRFVLLGAAGFVARRHLAAMRAVGGELVAACDPHDSVGILDSYFPEARFFREFERLDRHVEKLRLCGDGVDFVSICTPNYLHDAHVRFALRIGAHAICEKPLVISPWNVEPLTQLSKEAARRIHPVLQLRDHRAAASLREKVQTEALRDPNVIHDIDLTYVTSRGPWYLQSWKGDVERSGGIVANIGIHFLDLLLWVFGECHSLVVHQNDAQLVSGQLVLDRARVNWLLSIQGENLPPEAVRQGQTTHRSLRIDGEEFEFSGGFADLHEVVYRQVLAGNGWSEHDALPAIELAHRIRQSSASDRDLFARSAPSVEKAAQ